MMIDSRCVSTQCLFYSIIQVIIDVTSALPFPAVSQRNVIVGALCATSWLPPSIVVVVSTGVVLSPGVQLVKPKKIQIKHASDLV